MCHGSSWKIWHSASLIGIVVVLVGMEGFIPASLRLWMWLVIMLLLGLFGVIAGKGVTGQWLGLLIDTRNKVSLGPFSDDLVDDPDFVRLFDSGDGQC